MIGCLFEQSGTFKKAFNKYGYEAEDIDIENTTNKQGNYAIIIEC